MKKTRKGFTLVELLVVIAIVAILATVAIIGYTSFTKKADLSVDQQTVEQLNTALEAGSVGISNISIEDVAEILAGAGFNLENGINALRTENKIYWFKSYNKIVLADAEGNVAAPKDNDQLVNDFKTNFNDTTKVFDLAKLVDGSSVVVDGTIVGSFAEALAQGGEVTLFDDLTLNTAVEVKGNTVINLNGHKIETNQSIGRPFTITEEGVSLTINAEGSTIQTGKYGLVDVTGSSNDVEIVVNGGSIVGTLDNGSLFKVRTHPLGEVKNVDLVLNNVNIDFQDAGSKLSYIVDGTYFTADGKLASSLLNISVEVNGGTYNVVRGFNACDSLTIKGATINATNAGVSESNNVLIENSTLTCSATKDDAYWGACVVTSGDRTVVIKNSTLTNNNGYTVNVLPSGGTVTLEGCTTTADSFNVFDMSEGKTGSIIVDGTVVISK